MIEIELDGKKVEVAPGSMLMHAAEKAGTYIPHFCYHKKLSIAANCRMCLVEVEKAPKPMPACATPVTQGMVVRTKSEKAIKAQQSVMEFLLINHPLDCPICDQGGECQLQDLAVGYGSAASRYTEEKRTVSNKDVGPLISMEEMSRCIHCTRCVRFGQEIAGVMELGMAHRGEHSEIETFLNATIDSELSGNMIDICPVGALTSKPFRYQARTWELSRRKTVSPHDSTGTNLVVQTKNHKVVRVVPFENEQVNECWIADRDRFSYEALNSSERLTQPMLKQAGKWRVVSWSNALEYVANGLVEISKVYGGNAVGLLASPHSTVEELSLAGALVRGLGSDHLDHRLRAQSFYTTKGARWLGRSIASLSHLDRILIVGSNIRKDHPLFAQRIRQAVKKGAKVAALVDESPDWAFPVTVTHRADFTEWVQVLRSIAVEIASQKNIPPPVSVETVSQKARDVALLLLTGKQKAILLGNAAAHHPDAENLLKLTQWIATQTDATFGFLTEAANTVGAQLAQVESKVSNTQKILSSGLKAYLLLNVEPEFDIYQGRDACNKIAKSQMVVTLSPFKTNMNISDVLLPISPFTETSGTFVSAEGRLQSFHAAVKPLEETRPGWKVLKVLGEMLNLGGIFHLQSAADILTSAIPNVKSGEIVSLDLLSNEQSCSQIEDRQFMSSIERINSYQLDSLVRRAPALQATRDALF
jgi:NADH-quinone oxidoreductase subunit G